MSADQTSLIPIKDKTPAELFAPGGLDDLLAAIRKKATADVWDIHTADGRAGITSSAYKVARVKSYLEKVGKEFVSDIKKQAKVIDVERKKARDKLTALQDEIRAPLTEWEHSETKRLLALRERQEAISAAIPDVPTLENVRNALDTIEALVIDESWEELRIESAVLRDATELRLMKLMQQLLADDKAEKERVAAEKAAQEAERAEREKRIAEEAAAQATMQAKMMETQALEKAKQEALRQYASKVKEAEAKAHAEQNAAIAEERRKAKAYAEEAAKKAQIAQAAAIAESRKADEKARAQLEKELEQEQKRAREARANDVRSDIIAAFRMLGIDTLAPHIANAIIRDEIPHVFVDYQR